MPLWRCPHCGIPQVESSRCWVCRRSTTSCAACRHFRRGVAGGLGVCGRDPRRLALRGTEMRACWEAAHTTGTMGPPDDAERVPMMVATGAVGATSGRPARTFVPVESLLSGPDAPDRPGLADGPGGLYPGIGAMEPQGSGVARHAQPIRRIPGGWSLWGDLET
jgi:hypothetical protein